MPSLLAEARAVLGFASAADNSPPPAEDVAAAFKKLALKWHPDRNRDKVDEATQRFAEISAARDLLLDPPPAALVDEPDATSGDVASGRWKSAAAKAHSAGLRAFEGDVTEAIDDGSLRGAELEEAFGKFELWAVWQCSTCELLCCRIRKSKYLCMCSHRLRDHRAGAGFACGEKKCPCNRFEFQVQFDHQPVKCRCKHAPKDHAPAPPRGCCKPGCECACFDMTWVCHCGHGHSEHRTAFVRKKCARPQAPGRPPRLRPSSDFDASADW